MDCGNEALLLCYARVSFVDFFDERIRETHIASEGAHEDVFDRARKELEKQ
jgi:hypothetical protein